MEGSSGASSANFEAYAAPHLVVLALTIAVPVAMVFVARSVRKSGRRPVLMERALIALLLLTYPAKLAVFFTTGGSEWDFPAPFHLCDIAAVVAAGALIWRNQRLAELAYFWGLAGTLQGLLTPALEFPYPHPEFFRFFLLHSSVVIAALYLPFGAGLAPQRGAVWRAFGWLQPYAAVAVLANWIFGTNYGFLREKPDSASLLDHLGDWPWYIVGLQAVALVGFWVLYLPWARRNRLGSGS